MNNGGLLLTKHQAWKFDGNNCFVTMLFPLLIKDGNDNLLPQIHLHNINAFFEDLTGKHFYNSAYELHFYMLIFKMLHKQACFSATILTLFIYLEGSPPQCIIKNKQGNVFQLNVFYDYQLSNYTKE